MEDSRLESFPFDSRSAGYDDYGYPIYDRAVGASMLRQTFAQFFSNGVFGSSFKLSKGDGLKVNISEGISIINGAMASIPEGGISVSLSDESSTVGTCAYGVFVRYDDNIDKRSCYITVRKGEAGSNPVPPDPDTTSPGIWELRLGYVKIPSGSTNLASATIVDERGTSVCPYAAPFVEIDLEDVVSDLRDEASAEYKKLADAIEDYYDLIAAALDGTTAGELQNQITEMKDTLSDSDFLTIVIGKSVLV